MQHCNSGRAVSGLSQTTKLQNSLLYQTPDVTAFAHRVRLDQQLAAAGRCHSMIADVVPVDREHDQPLPRRLAHVRSCTACSWSSMDCNNYSQLQHYRPNGCSSL